MIKAFFFTTVCFFLHHSIFGQGVKDSVALSIRYGTNNNELLEFLQFFEVDKYSIGIKDSIAREKIIHIRLREFVGGKPVRTEDFVDQEKYSKLLYGFNPSDSSYDFRVYARKFTADSIELFFRFNRHGVRKKFAVQKSTMYSLRCPIQAGSRGYMTAKSSFSPFLVFSLPYVDPKNPGFYKYCALTADGVPPEQWGTVYNVPHYILVEVKFD